MTSPASLPNSSSSTKHTAQREILLLRLDIRRPDQTEIGNQIGVSQMHGSRLLSCTLAQLRRELTD